MKCCRNCVGLGVGRGGDRYCERGHTGMLVDAETDCTDYEAPVTAAAIARAAADIRKMEILGRHWPDIEAMPGTGERLRDWAKRVQEPVS